MIAAVQFHIGVSFYGLQLTSLHSANNFSVHSLSYQNVEQSFYSLLPRAVLALQLQMNHTKSFPPKISRVKQTEVSEEFPDQTCFNSQPFKHQHQFSIGHFIPNVDYSCSQVFSMPFNFDILASTWLLEVDGPLVWLTTEHNDSRL